MTFPWIVQEPALKILLQLLVFQLALQLLGLGNLTYGLVEIVLVDCIPIVLDGEVTTKIMLEREMAVCSRT